MTSLSFARGYVGFVIIPWDVFASPRLYGRLLSGDRFVRELTKARLNWELSSKLFRANLLGCGLLLLLGWALEDLMIGPPARVIKSWSFLVYEGGCLVWVLFAGASLGTRDAASLWSPGFRRSQWFLSVWMSRAVPLTVISLILCLLTVVLIYMAGGEVSHAMLLAWLLLWLKAQLILTFIMMMSSMVSEPVSMFLTFCVFLLGHLLSESGIWIQGQVSPLFKSIHALMGWLVPAARHFDLKTEAVYGLSLPADWGWMVAYGLGYLISFLLIGLWRFERVQLGTP